jgi:hypothetical protein
MKTLLLLACLSLLTGPATAQDVDTDGDGLSDFRELHKYLTDPKRADSDGDGIPDSDPEERREYAYTVRSILQVMPPIDEQGLTDDYQDGRVLDRQPGYVEIEVIHYPLNTVGEAIGENAAWRDDPSAPKECLASGPTSNWDTELRRRLLSELSQDGIDVAKLSDRAVVERVSSWLIKHSKYEDGFTTFMVDFENGAPRPSLGQEERFAAELAKLGRTAKQQWDRELFGKAMIESGIRGSCTSSAIYLSTGLRAIGIPTRTIVCTPVIDANDPRELEMLERGITHHAVRKTIERALGSNRGGWTSHTFNEVWVDGRWRRLNYSKLGQNVLDEVYLGLMTHVHTFVDHADAGMSRTWGLRSTRGKYDDVLGTANPYSCISLSDRFGAHARIDNPPVAEETLELSIGGLYWYDDPHKDPLVTMKLDEKDGAGHLLLHVEKPSGSVEGSRYKSFYDAVGKRFVLRAKGKPDVPAIATRGYWINSDKDVRDFYVRIEPTDFAKMARGVGYELVPPAEQGAMRWKVLPDVRITRR